MEDANSMQINYELTKEDYIDFNMYHGLRSKTVKKSIFLQRYIVPIVYLIVPFFLEDYRSPKFKYCMGLFIGIAIMWIIFYKKYFNASVKKKIIKMIDEGETSKNYGNKVMILNKEGIEGIGEHDKSKLKWDGIYKIEESDKHIFIYINSMSAYIIPIRALDDKEKFLAALNNRGKNITV